MCMSPHRFLCKALKRACDLLISPVILLFQNRDVSPVTGVVLQCDCRGVCGGLADFAACIFSSFRKIPWLQAVIILPL